MLDKLGGQGRRGRNSPVRHALSTFQGTGRAIVLDLLAYSQDSVGQMRQGGTIEGKLSSKKKGLRRIQVAKGRGEGGADRRTLIVPPVVECADLVHPLGARIAADPKFLPKLHGKTGDIPEKHRDRNKA